MKARPLIQRLLMVPEVWWFYYTRALWKFDQSRWQAAITGASAVVLSFQLARDMEQYRWQR